MGFDFETALERPVKVINDAAMQALGSYQGGKMLFLGFGTGLGAAVIMNGSIEALELGRFYYKKRTLEYYLGNRGRKRLGRKKWQSHVEEIVERAIAALRPDDVVLGGGNVKYLKRLPAGTRAGSNANAFLGGFHLWQGEAERLKPGARLLKNAGSGDEDRAAGAAANNPNFSKTLTRTVQIESS
jgi:polyphosphate glucokinase